MSQDFTGIKTKGEELCYKCSAIDCTVYWPACTPRVICMHVHFPMWMHVHAHATVSECSSPPTAWHRVALNRQWLIYGMIVYFAALSVMDEDLRAFEKSVWNMEESAGKGAGGDVLKSTPPKEKYQRGPMGRPVIVPSPRLEWNALRSAAVTRQSPF